MKQLWAWVFAALVVGLAVGAVATRYIDRAGAKAVTAQADGQAAAYERAIGAVTQRDVAMRDTVAQLRAEGDRAARATLEAKARTQVATDRLAALKRPADTDSTNPEWQKIVAVQQDVITGQAQQIENLTVRATKLEAAYTADSVRLTAWKELAEAGKVTIDSLRTEVHVAARGSEVCRILIVPCPSRKMSVLLSVLATGTVAVLASKK